MSLPGFSSYPRLQPTASFSVWRAHGTPISLRTPLVALTFAWDTFPGFCGWLALAWQCILREALAMPTCPTCCCFCSSHCTTPGHSGLTWFLTVGSPAPRTEWVLRSVLDPHGWVNRELDCVDTLRGEPCRAESKLRDDLHSSMHYAWDIGAQQNIPDVNVKPQRCINLQETSRWLEWQTMNSSLPKHTYWSSKSPAVNILKFSGTFLLLKFFFETAAYPSPVSPFCGFIRQNGLWVMRSDGCHLCLKELSLLFWALTSLFM